MFGRMIPKRPSPLSEVNTGQAIFFVRKNKIGKDVCEFHPVLYLLFEILLNEDTLEHLSTEEQQLFLRFIYEAGKKTDELNGTKSDVEYESDVCSDLDKFLGNAEEILNMLYNKEALESELGDSSLDIVTRAQIQKELEEIQATLTTLKTSQTNLSTNLTNLAKTLVYEE